MLTRASWTEALLDGLEQQRIERTSLTAEQRQRLANHERQQVKARAATLLAPPSAERELAELAAKVLALSGDPDRGAGVFGQHCAICHRLGGLGYNVGPDLRALTDRSPDAILTAVLEPNRAVEARYTTYVANLADQRQLTGIITDETAASIAMIGARSERHVIARSELEQITGTGMSLMPNGFERLIDAQGLADLIAWVGKSHPAAKKFAGNQPALARPGGDGALVLAASRAELYGPEIYYYTQQGVIGNWHRPDDRAVWSIEIPEAREYDVHIDWACADKTAGNVLLVEANAGRVTETVAGTGPGWQKYQSKKIGRLRLEPGLQSIVLRSDGPIQRQALLDLRSVRLVPAGRKR